MPWRFNGSTVQGSGFNGSRFWVQRFEVLGSPANVGSQNLHSRSSRGGERTSIVWPLLVAKFPKRPAFAYGMGLAPHEAWLVSDPLKTWMPTSCRSRFEILSIG